MSERRHIIYIYSRIYVHNSAALFFNFYFYGPSLDPLTRPRPPPPIRRAPNRCAAPRLGFLRAPHPPTLSTAAENGYVIARLPRDVIMFRYYLHRVPSRNEFEPVERNPCTYEQYTYIVIHAKRLRNRSPVLNGQYDNNMVNRETF